MSYFAGVDIGTTHTKIIVFDHRLQTVFQHRRGYTKSGSARMHAPEVLHLVRTLITEAITALSLQQDAELTIAFSSAMHSLLLVNETGDPLSECYTWADNSAQPVLQHLLALPETASLFPETGTPLHPMSPFCKLAWLHRSAPESLQEAAICCGIKEFVWYHLTGAWETDHSIASATGLFSLHQRTWSATALQLAGISSHKLPLPVPVTHRREGDPSIHGLPLQKISWVIGGSDGCLAQLGSNALAPGEAALTIGTSGAIRTASRNAWVDPNRELFTYILDDDYYVHGGAVNNGGIVLQWWNDKIIQGGHAPASELLKDFIDSAAAAPPGSGGIVCLPRFGGERSPVWDATATGIFAGISLEHGQAEMKRSILEGICFSFRQLLEKLEAAAGPVHTIHASGGFTASSFWVQLMADILDREMVVPEKETDASALGAIAIALRSRSRVVDYADFHARFHPQLKRYKPDAQTLHAYDDNYRKFLQLAAWR